jgi:hypothetical protein
MRIWAHLALVILMLICSGLGRAQDSAAVRLGFLLNFARYVDWPESLKPGAPLRLCLAPGDGDMASKADELANQVVQGHAIQIRKVAHPSDAEDCQIVYLPANLPAATLPSWLVVADRSNILTVSEIPDFIEAGGMIGLVAEGGRYRFDANLVNARRAGVRLSAYLLKLARTVK